MTRRNKQTKEVQDVNHFMHEVEDTLRTERLIQIWEDYKVLMIGGVVVFFLAVSGHTYWQHATETKRAQLMDHLYTLSQTEGVTWENYEPLTKEKFVGVSYQSRLEQVKLLMAEGKRAEAMVKLDEIIFDARIPLELRQLAGIYKADISLAEDVTVSIDILERLIEEKTLFMTPVLQRLGFAYEKANRIEDAVNVYERVLQMGDRNVSTDIRQLVLQRLSGLTPKAS